MEQLQALGISEANRPVLHEDHAPCFQGLRAGDYFDGTLPPTLGRLTLEQISSLQSLYSSWLHYLGRVLNKVSIELAATRREKEAMWSKTRTAHFKSLKRSGLSATDQRCSDLTRYDRRFVEPDSRYTELLALKECVERLYELADSDRQTVSRQVTILQMKMESEARGRNVGDARRNTNEHMRHSLSRQRGRAGRAAPRQEEDSE